MTFKHIFQPKAALHKQYVPTFVRSFTSTFCQTAAPQLLLLPNLTSSTSTIKQRNRSDRTPTSTPQLQRKPNKSKPPFPNNPIQIVQTFHMRHPTLAANIVSLEIHLALGAGTDGFDAYGINCQQTETEQEK
jgi:hypothetical protein